MSKIDPVVRKETGYVALFVLAGSMLMQGVCLVAGWWSLPVLFGNLLGAVTAVGNFLLTGLMVQKAVTQDAKKARNTVRLSQGGRLLLQGLMLVLGAVFFNIWTTAIPLLLPRVAVTVREWQNARRNPSPNRPAVGWDDDDDDE